MPGTEKAPQKSGYKFSDANALYSQAYLMPVLLNSLADHFSSEEEKTVFDLGCGNGAVAAELTRHGYEVTGVDPSSEGISQASSSYPELNLQLGSAYDDLHGLYGQFSAVVSLEVVEHVYDPHAYMKTLFSLVKPGGVAIISTPYHGYLKNLAIALTGKFDRHVNPLWLHGHIKFWSYETLRKLIVGSGFEAVDFHRVGRVPVLAKSMIAITKRPEIR